MAACEDRRADLVGYLYGELGGRERRALMDHLDSCGDCASEFAELAVTSAELRAGREEAPAWSGARPHLEELDGRPVREPARGLLASIRAWWSGAVAMPRWSYAGALAGVIALVALGTRVDVGRVNGGLVVSWDGGASRGAATGAPAGSAGPGAVAASASRETAGPSAEVAAAVKTEEGQALLAEMQRLLRESETRQSSSTAQLVDALGQQYTRQLEQGRRQDLQLVDYWIGSLSGKTQLEFSRTNQQLEQMAELLIASQGNSAVAVWPGSRGVPAVREGRLEPGSPATVPADTANAGE